MAYGKTKKFKVAAIGNWFRPWEAKNNLKFTPHQNSTDELRMWS
jgi:hypothetical protein